MPTGSDGESGGNAGEGDDSAAIVDLLRGRRRVDVEELTAQRVSLVRTAARRAVEREIAAVEPEQIQRLRARIFAEERRPTRPAASLFERLAESWRLALGSGGLGLALGVMIALPLWRVYESPSANHELELVVAVGDRARAPTETTWAVEVANPAAAVSELVERLSSEHFSYSIYIDRANGDRHVVMSAPEGATADDLIAILRSDHMPSNAQGQLHIIFSKGRHGN
jgi:hypothetical protein